jgi:hypothetical protein
MVFLDPVVRADPRILSPLFVALIVLLTGVLARASTRTIRLSGAAVVAVIVVLYATATLRDAFAAPARSDETPYRVLVRQGI